MTCGGGAHRFRQDPPPVPEQRTAAIFFFRYGGTE